MISFLELHSARASSPARAFEQGNAARGLIVRRIRTVLFAAAMLGACMLVVAQTPAPTAPARETPRPQDLDPAVNTSAPSQAPARETPRPQDIDPAVNTSAVPANGAGDANSSAPAGATKAPSAVRPSASGAAPTTPTSSSRSSSPAAATAPAAGASSPTSSTLGTSSTSTAATPNPPGSAARPRSGKALDRLELDTTQITGNRELPKVLYIVPWKRADLGDLVGKPVNSLLDEVLAPVDRDVFKRENRYYRALTPVEGQPADATGAPAPGTAPNGATSSGSATPAARDER